MMKKMKRQTLMIAAAIMILPLAGCSSDEETPPVIRETAAEEEAAENEPLPEGAELADAEIILSGAELPEGIDPDALTKNLDGDVLIDPAARMIAGENAPEPAVVISQIEESRERQDILAKTAAILALHAQEYEADIVRFEQHDLVEMDDLPVALMAQTSSEADGTEPAQDDDPDTDGAVPTKVVAPETEAVLPDIRYEEETGLYICFVTVPGENGQGAEVLMEFTPWDNDWGMRLSAAEIGPG